MRCATTWSCPYSLQGMGVILTKEGGLPAGGFVNEYLGEMYCPWAWQERQVNKIFSTDAHGNGMHRATIKLTGPGSIFCI